MNITVEILKSVREDVESMPVSEEAWQEYVELFNLGGSDEA